MMFRTLLFIPGNDKKFLREIKTPLPRYFMFRSEDSAIISEKSIARDMIIQSLSSTNSLPPDNIIINNNNNKINGAIIILKIRLNFLLELIHLNPDFMNKI